jgi:hypothetical protein
VTQVGREAPPLRRAIFGAFRSAFGLGGHLPSRGRVVQLRWVLGSVACAALLGTLAGPASQSRAATATSGWPAWLAKPRASSCQKGATLVVPTGATSDALGVVRVHYSAFPDLFTVVPPRNFSVSHASPALLKDLGIPVPSSPAAGTVRAQLARSPVALVDERTARDPLATSFCMSAKVIAPPRVVSKHLAVAPESVGAETTSLSPNLSWAGYEVNGTFDGALGDWTVNESIPGPPTPNVDETWVGVGGATFNDSLIQAGTQMLTGKGYQSWFEWVAGNDGSGTIFPTYESYDGVSFTSTSQVHIGDDIQALVYWLTSHEACFNLYDLSSSTGSFSGCVTSMPIPMSRASIEWIDEDPYPPSGTLEGVTLKGYLADFVATSWFNQEAYNSSTGATVPFTDYPPLIANYIDSSNQTPVCSSGGVLAYPTLASGSDDGSSDNEWCRAGPN